VTEEANRTIVYKHGWWATALTISTTPTTWLWQQGIKCHQRRQLSTHAASRTHG